MKYLLLIISLFCATCLFAQQKIALAQSQYYSDDRLRAHDTGIIIEDFTEGLAPFMIKYQNPFEYDRNQVGFIDSTGNVVIKPLYINCSSFENGLALVKISRVILV